MPYDRVLNMPGQRFYPANISTLFQRCLLVGTTSRRGTTSDQRWNNVVYFNVGICNVESTLCISTLIWTTLDNVEATLSFSTSSFTTLVNVETTLWKWPFLKITKQIISNKIHGSQSFNYYFIILFTLLPMLRGLCWRVLARLRKLFKDHERYCIARTYFKPLHFVIY